MKWIQKQQLKKMKEKVTFCSIEKEMIHKYLIIITTEACILWKNKNIMDKINK